MSSRAVIRCRAVIRSVILCSRTSFDLRTDAPGRGIWPGVVGSFADFSRKSKGSEAQLSYLGHVLMENRNGLSVQTLLTESSGRAERDTAMLMAEAIPGDQRMTLGGDKNYDTQEFVRKLRGMNITPHVAQNDSNRWSAIDQRTTRHAGY